MMSELEGNLQTSQVELNDFNHMPNFLNEMRVNESNLALKVSKMRSAKVEDGKKQFAIKAQKNDNLVLGSQALDSMTVTGMFNNEKDKLKRSKRAGTFDMSTTSDSISARKPFKLKNQLSITPQKILERDEDSKDETAFKVAFQDQMGKK